MHAPQNGTMTSHERAEDHPEYEERVYKKDDGCKHQKKAGTNSNSFHVSILCRRAPSIQHSARGGQRSLKAKCRLEYPDSTALACFARSRLNAEATSLRATWRGPVTR